MPHAWLKIFHPFARDTITKFVAGCQEKPQYMKGPLAGLVEAYKDFFV
ncbi:MAG: hypothetical protein ACE10H_09280 [Candidatus Binatia bacterium]